MTLEIIGAGFGRTGTLSTYAALKQLGLRSYHMIEVLQNRHNKGHIDFWLKVARAPAGTQHDWDTVFANYRATVDNPGCCVWRELLAAYPNAKVLLTLHPKGAEAWYESTIETIYFDQDKRLWQFRLLALVVPFFRKFAEMSRRLIWQRTLAGTMEDKAKAIARYNAHIAEVKAAVPADRLLVFSVDQGWAPLCAFLGVAVPDAPFPALNDRASIKATMRRIVWAGYGAAAGAVLLVGLLAYGAYTLLALG